MSDNTEEILCNLIMEYRARLFRIAKGILKNDMDAEEAVSEAVYKAFIHFGKLKNINSFKSWIIRILINVAYDMIKEKQKFVQLDEDTVDENCQMDEVNTILWDAVQLLNEEYRIVTILFYYEDMSINEISKVLNIPKGTVNSRLNRARKKLKEYLVKEGEAGWII